MTTAPAEELPLGLPRTRAEIDGIQRVRKRIAVERALRSRFWQERLAGIDLNRLDDPEMWRKIPILEKDDLRALTLEKFYGEFCIARPEDICEYWRSGGATGKPLFYPRTYEDIRYCMTGFARTFACTKTLPGTVAHNSFPLGIHPAGHMWARAGRIMGIGMVWAGSGAALPSLAQLALIASMKPTMWMGMSSYGLHLANLAEANGVDLANGPVKRLLCTAEPVSVSKRQKMEREWGAELFDCFGMTECTMMGAESASHDGFHIWTDLAFIEIVDEKTKQPVHEGEPGLLIVTSLFTNNATPFLRWNSGDIVVLKSEGAADSPFSVFPVLRHAHRTAGFFKVRGVNINHQEFEDMMFANPLVNDFKAEVVAGTDGGDRFRVSIEVKRGADPLVFAGEIGAKIKSVFEVKPKITVLAPGTLAREFEGSVKAPRFVDRRG